MISIMSRVYSVDMSHSGGYVDSLDEALALIAADRAKSQTRT
jgi:hypothetical protein